LEIDDGASSNETFSSLILPNLKFVTSTFDLYSNPDLTVVHLPALLWIGPACSFCGLESMSINANLALTLISMPSLTLVAGNIHLYANFALTSLILPSLSSVSGHLYICFNSATVPITQNILSAAFGYRCQVESNGACPRYPGPPCPAVQ
jgi:hypothetical protein